MGRSFYDVYLKSSRVGTMSVLISMAKTISSREFINEILMKTTVYAKETGSVVITILQVLFGLAGIICLFIDGTLIIGIGLIVAAIMAIPFKTLVKAAEYYIGLTDAEYNIVSSMEEYDRAKAKEKAKKMQEN